MLPHPTTLPRVRLPMACRALLLLPLCLEAANLTWDADGTAGGATGGTGVWDTSALLWNQGGVMSAWDNGAGHVAIFGGTGGTVTLGGAISASGLTFNANGYILAGNGNTLTLGGPVSVATAGHTALIQSAVTLSAALGFSGAGNITLDATSSITGGGFAISKSGAGTLTLAGTITDAGSLTFSAGVTELSGSYTRGTYSTSVGLTVSGGTLNVSGVLGSAAVPTGQTAFSGNSVTNFSGTAHVSGGSSTFRVGEVTPATVNITAGSVTLGSSSGGLVLGRSNAAAQGILNISGGTLNVTASSNVVRVGAGYSNTELGGPSVLTISGTGLFNTSTTTGDILLGSNRAGNPEGTGTLNLDGGTLATQRIIKGGTAAASTLNFNGGVLKANGAALALDASLATVNVRDGGARIDTNGFNVSILRALDHSSIAGDAVIDGGLTKSGAGTLTFTGAVANTFTGITTVLAGELVLSKTAGVISIPADVAVGDGTAPALLRLGNADQIADGSVMTLAGVEANAGVFRLNGRAETLGGLASSGGAGIVENESATNAILTLNNSGTQSYGGLLRNGSLSGTLALVKAGAGTQILSGAGITHTGGTTIHAGTLQFGSSNVLGGALVIAASGGQATLALDGHEWTAGAITMYNATSTSTSRAVIDLGTGGLLTLGSSTFTVANNNQPLGALITGGTLDLGAASRTLSVADSSNAAADLTIASAITSAAGVFNLTKTGAGTLRLTGTASIGGNYIISGGVLEVAGTVGNPPATTNTSIASASTPPVLRLVEGGDYTTGVMTVGTIAGTSGGVVVEGGRLTLNPTSNQSGMSLGGTGYGGFFLNGGTVNTKRVDSLDGTTAASISVLRVNGGTLNTANYIMFRNERWDFTVTGGEVLRTGDPLALAFRSGGTAATATTTAQGAMSIAGGLVNNGTLTVTFGQQNDGSAKGTAHFNLNDGTFVNNRFIHYNGVHATNGSAGIHAFINFNGGLLRASASATLISTVGSGGTGSVSAYLNGPFGMFDGGLKIDTNGFTTTVSNALLAPGGQGVGSIAVASAGGGYIGAPFVEISGGGGSGATAYATVDLDPASPTYGQLTGIVVTNPGRDYTSAPTITLYGGGGSGAATGTASLAANSSGGITKTGEGTLILSGAEANTFTGMSQVKAGELQLSKTAGVNALAGDVTVGDGNAAAVLRLINSDQIADSSLVSFQGAGALAGILRLGNRSETLGGLISSDGAGIVENESGSAATSVLTLNVAAGSHVFQGILRNGNGAGVDGTLALVKTGAGTQMLGGENTYTGSTVVSGGMLGLTSTGRTGTGAVRVEDGGTLLGTGQVRGSTFTALDGATVHAGSGVGTADFGTLSFSPAAGSGSFDFQAGSSTILGLNPGGTGDLLRFDGLGGGTLLFEGALQVTAPGFLPSSVEVFRLLDWSNLTTTSFASHYSADLYRDGSLDDSSGFDLPDISGSGYLWDISQFTADGSITLILVPEPGRALLATLGLALLLLRRRRGC